MPRGLKPASGTQTWQGPLEGLGRSASQRRRERFNVKKMPGYMENRWLAKTTTGVKTQ